MEEEEYIKWTNVTIEELKAYIEFKILMGIIRSPSMYDYWKKDPYYHYGPIVNPISVDRVMEIGRYLHFVDNYKLAPIGSDGYDHLGKEKAVMNTYVNNSQLCIMTAETVVLIKQMIPFKRKSSMKQYIPKKL